ncbi:MAG TPA: insulinase family protein, partial [Phycisphaerae bacterium]|nr:insulinase family protein [Phycisphaerae bacterium]
MFTYISCDPDRAGEVLQILRNQFARFQADGPTEAELTAAKNKLASGATLAAESSMRRLMGV